MKPTLLGEDCAGRRAMDYDVALRAAVSALRFQIVKSGSSPQGVPQDKKGMMKLLKKNAKRMKKSMKKISKQMKKIAKQTNEVNPLLFVQGVLCNS